MKTGLKSLWWAISISTTHY